MANTVMKKLILWGGTGQSLLINDFATELNYKVTLIVDNNPTVKSLIRGVNIVYTLEEMKKYLYQARISSALFAVAIGGKKGIDRLNIGKMLENEGLKPAKLVHPRAYVSKSAVIGKGCQILANSTVGPEVTIDDYVIVSTGAIVGHECHLGEGVHVGPGVTIAGLVKIGSCSFIGIGATLMPRITIGSNTVIGAGSVVTRNIPQRVVFKGNPAKYHCKNED